jgi:hypothetical protein
MWANLLIIWNRVSHAYEKLQCQQSQPEYWGNRNRTLSDKWEPAPKYGSMSTETCNGYLAIFTSIQQHPRGNSQLSSNKTAKSKLCEPTANSQLVAPQPLHFIGLLMLSKTLPWYRRWVADWDICSRAAFTKNTVPQLRRLDDSLSW